MRLSMQARQALASQELGLVNLLRTAKHSSPEVAALLRLLQMRLEQLQDKLVRCGPGEFQSLQGEARALDKLISDLTEEPTTKKDV